MNIKDIDSLLDSMTAPVKIYAGRKLYFNNYQKAVEFSEELIQNSNHIHDIKIVLNIFPFHDTVDGRSKLKRSSEKSLKSQTEVSFLYDSYNNSEKKVIKDLIIKYNEYVDALSGCFVENGNYFTTH